MAALLGLPVRRDLPARNVSKGSGIVADASARTQELGPNDSIAIPMGSIHRLANPGSEVLTVIEVQTGLAFDEDDIERLEDRYGRV